MADTDFGAFTAASYFQSGDILLALRGAGGINVPVDALLFKNANGRVGLGVNAESKARFIVQGAGQETTGLTDAGNHDDSLYLRGNGVGVGSGGALLFGSTFGNQTPFAAIKGYVTNGGTNTTGKLIISLRNAIADTSLTGRIFINEDGSLGIGATPGSGWKLDVTGHIRFGTSLSASMQHDGANFSLTSGVGHATYYCSDSTKAHIFHTGGTQRFLIDNTQARPGTDNTHSCGSSGYRWTVVYAATGSINTSDEREKKWRGAISSAEVAAAQRIADELGFFQWLDAIEEKSEGAARFHFGVRAQRVWDIMADCGLIDPIDSDGRPGSTPYAFLCFDEWEDEFRPETVLETRTEQKATCVPYEGLFDASGNPAVKWEYEDVEVEEEVETGNMILVRPAGNRFGVRTDQLTLFLLAGQEAAMAAMEARLAALEAA